MHWICLSWHLSQPLVCPEHFTCNAFSAAQSRGLRYLAGGSTDLFCLACFACKTRCTAALILGLSRTPDENKFRIRVIAGVLKSCEHC